MSKLRIPCVLLILACSSALTGCETLSKVVAFSPRPPAGLLLPCLDPALVPDPDNATAEQINVERVKVAQAYVDCKRRHEDLAAWVRGL